ncbi:hypothetical protein KOY48_01500 [Candidatus Minimicrobia naudis]|uniref:SecA Wing/Scaffold domain-containing protein n=1 Tax=Candidatus Minimicrobia naudis TaxID=2841263 RepID=A0A8F1MCE9_9BACT|nr:hypothetical protein KOY48_01500 [Candidatus Minimicrobia naudis]
MKKISKEKKDKLRYEKALKLAEETYAEKEPEIGADNLRGVEREVYMAVLDTLWMQHLENMQHLRAKEFTGEALDSAIRWWNIDQNPKNCSKACRLISATKFLTTIFNIHKADATVRQSQDDEYDTELTKVGRKRRGAWRK